MGRITRTKVLIAAVVMTLLYAIGMGAHQSQAATGTTGSFHQNQVYLGALTPLSTDPIFTASATDVTSSVAFPDGATSAQCFLRFSGTDKTAAPTAYGNCAGITASIVCGSVPFDKSSTATADQHGAAFTIGGTKYLTGQYDQGVGAGCLQATKTPGVAAGKNTDASLAATVTGYSIGSTIVAYYNNDGLTARGGCFTAYNATTYSALQCANFIGTGSNGAFYSFQPTSAAAGAVVAETTCAAGGTIGCAANATLAGIFIERAAPAQAAPTATVQACPAAAATATATTGAPTATATAGAAPTVTATVGVTATVTATACPVVTNTSVPLAAHPLSIHRVHGLTHIKWFSTAQVRGFNVYSGAVRLNHHLVTSHTGRYQFTTHARVHHVWVDAVQ